MVKITFCFESEAPSICVMAATNENILQTARRENIAIDAPCSGNGTCGKCRIRLLSGKVESTSDLEDGWYLACQTKPLSDIEILVPNTATAFHTGIRTAELTQAERAQLKTLPNSGFEAVSLKLCEPSLDDTLPDNERLAAAIEKKTGCKTVFTFHAFKRMAWILREEDFSIQVLGERKNGIFTVYDLVPSGISAPMCALAVDIGTTTVCAVLTELTSGTLLAKATCGNAQLRYGADVINRIIEQSKLGAERLQKAVLEETLFDLIEAVCKDAKINKSRIFRMSVAANTTMNHLFLGLFADPIRMEPYIPSFFRTQSFCAKELSIPIHPDAQILISPNIGSYVGGDITCGVYASGLWKNDELSLFVDLGTNGEIVFGNREFTVACACSAGPAFEGGDISCGMRATDGAIDRCSINKDTMLPTFSVLGGGKPVGICGSGILDVISELFTCGIINAKGDFVREGSRIVRDQYGTGRYVLAFAEESATDSEISITHVDIDNFIRAKGAVYSAIDTLLSAMDMDESVLQTVYVAGGIGSSISIKNAIAIGMLPNLPVENFRYIGNSALSGACAMALSDKAVCEIDELSQGMTYMELSTQAGYMDSFVAACFLPHTDAERFGGAR
ncbi:MAG: DUF4445 domain-containing protein [Ruminococcaceae bacterium]|nr:DUF4445 domain-containing protein [Oscillospiraceae bacterium]